MLFVFDAAGVEEIVAYVISLWLPVVGSFGLVELVLRRKDEAPVPARDRRPRLRPQRVRGAVG
jgi:hypothetical protein